MLMYGCVRLCPYPPRVGSDLPSDPIPAKVGASRIRPIYVGAVREPCVAPTSLATPIPAKVGAAPKTSLKNTTVDCRAAIAGAPSAAGHSTIGCEPNAHRATKCQSREVDVSDSVWIACGRTSPKPGRAWPRRPLAPPSKGRRGTRSQPTLRRAVCRWCVVMFILAVVGAVIIYWRI